MFIFSGRQENKGTHCYCSERGNNTFAPSLLHSTTTLDGTKVSPMRMFPDSIRKEQVCASMQPRHWETAATLHTTLPVRPRTYVLKAVKQEYSRWSWRFGTVKGGWRPFFPTTTLLLILFLLHISKSVPSTTNTYPNGFYSKELDWKDNESRCCRWKQHTNKGLLWSPALSRVFVTLLAHSLFTSATGLQRTVRNQRNWVRTDSTLTQQNIHKFSRDW